MKKLLLSSFCALAALSGFAQSKVYMTEEITPEALVKVYEALGRSATGKVAVKISTGEPNGKNFLQPALIKDLVQKTGGTIVECNTAYEGRRLSNRRPSAGMHRPWLCRNSSGGHNGR